MVEVKSPLPKGGGGFVNYAVVSLHCLRVYLEKSYQEALYLLSEMPHIFREVGLESTDFPHHSTLVNGSIGSRHPSDYAVIDAIFFDRENATTHTSLASLQTKSTIGCLVNSIQ